MPNYENLKIFERDTTLTSSKLRLIGYIPATVYGKNVEPRSIQIKAHEFELAIARGVKHFQLEGLGETLNAEVGQLQKQNTKNNILHVEFVVSAAAGGQKAKAAPQPKAAKSAPPTEPEAVVAEPQPEVLEEEAVPVP